MIPQRHVVGPDRALAAVTADASVEVDGDDRAAGPDESGVRRAFAEKFRAAFPDLNFWAADLIAEGDYVVGQWEGGGTHTGDAFDDMPVGSLPLATGVTMRFTGTTILKVEDGLITEEVGLDDGVTVLRQLGLITAA